MLLAAPTGVLSTAAMMAKKSKGTVKQAEWHMNLPLTYKRQSIPLLYQAYRAVSGLSELPNIAVENQAEEQIRKKQQADKSYRYREPEMKQVQQLTGRYIMEEDAKIEGVGTTIQPRCHLTRQLKFGMSHDGTDGDYDERKVRSVQIARAYFELCNAKPLTAFLNSAGKKLDDLCDSFNISMAVAREIYSNAAKTIKPLHRVDKLGATIPGDVSTIVCGVDIGTRNYSRCIVQVKSLLPERKTLKFLLPHAPEDVPDNTVPKVHKEHFIPKALPVFRVLLWELIDLKTNEIKASYYADDASPYYQPENRDIAEMFLKPQKKRKAEEDVELEEQPPAKKQRKVATKAKPPPPVVIDLSQDREDSF